MVELVIVGLGAAIIVRGLLLSAVLLRQRAQRFALGRGI
jgi:hypothetical protein